jgi:hypothetical protein
MGGNLVLLEPLLDELLLALLNDRLAQLNRLELVQLRRLEQNAEVLQKRRDEVGELETYAR